MYPHQKWPDGDHHDKAHVDASGHIYIEPDTPEKSPATFQKEPFLKSKIPWEITESDAIIQTARSTEVAGKHCEQVVSVLRNIRGNLIGTTHGIACEGKNQYRESIRGVRAFIHGVHRGMQNTLRSGVTLLQQPVWIPRKNKPPKEMSRGMLFVTDVFRFGGTFTAIFVALFVTLNYQSFYKILTPYLDPVERISALQGSLAEVDLALREKLLRSPQLAVAGRNDGNLLSYLPEVGPPENRIIIPKLSINVPLVTPSYSSLMREDWEGVEEDIQEALQGGVVHYPGTARPGQAGNFFVTGHSSYYPWLPGKYKTVFARLHELAVGDEYWVYYGGDKHRYIVSSKKEVKPSDVSVLDQPGSKRLATLMTCTPVGTTLRRLVIVAQEVDPVTGIALEVGQKETRVVTAPLPSALPI